MIYFISLRERMKSHNSCWLILSHNVSLRDQRRCTDDFEKINPDTVQAFWWSKNITQRWETLKVRGFLTVCVKSPRIFNFFTIIIIITILVYYFRKAFGNRKEAFIQKRARQLLCLSISIRNFDITFLSLFRSFYMYVVLYELRREGNIEYSIKYM